MKMANLKCKFKLFRDPKWKVSLVATQIRVGTHYLRIPDPQHIRRHTVTQLRRNSSVA